MRDVATMPVGRALDALVAEKVMGWTDVRQTGSGHWKGDDPECDGEEKVPFFSTDIAAAWEVVERMHQLGWNFNLSARFPLVEYEWWVGCDRPGVCHTAGADTAPHAICLAALRAKGVLL